MKFKPQTTADRVFDSIMSNNPDSLNWKPKQKAHLMPPCGTFAVESFMKQEVNKSGKEKLKGEFNP